jgi:hypothetical protein
MKTDLLKCCVVLASLSAPVSAYAGFGDPSPNAWGVGGRNDSASQSAAGPGSGWRYGGGWRGYWGPGWGWRGYWGPGQCWRGYYGALHCD